MVEVKRTPLDPQTQDALISFLMSKDMRSEYCQQAKRGDVMIYVNGISVQLSQAEVTRFSQQAKLMGGYNRGFRKK